MENHSEKFCSQMQNTKNELGGLDQSQLKGANCVKVYQN